MSDEDEYEEATPEQKLEIARYFIMSSPTGEVDDVAADVKKLVNDDSVMSSENLNTILKNYNNEQMSWAKHDDKSVMVSSYGQVEDDEYLDPNSGNVLKWNHIKREWVEATDKQQSLDDKIAKYREAIQTACNKYAEGHYREDKCVVQVYGQDDGQITVCVSGQNINLSNFWSGGWKGVYTINVGATGDKDLVGKVRINVHYFEDGNVQLHNAVEQTKSVSVTSSPEDTAKSVAEAIEKIESALQNNLEEMYVTMHRDTFKQMRRFLPKTRQTMNWNSALHSLATDMGN